MLYQEALDHAKVLDRELTQEFAETIAAGGRYHRWVAVGFRYHQDGVPFLADHWPTRPQEAVAFSACGDGPIYYAEPGHGLPLVVRMWESRQEGGINRQLRFRFIEARHARW